MTLPSKGWLAVDIETVGDPWDGTLIAIGVSDPGDPEVFTTVFDGPTDWLRAVLADPDVGIIEHTLYDARWLRLHGWDIQGPIADTRVMAWNVDENTDLDLESLSFRYLQHTMDKRIRRSKNSVKFRLDDGVYVPLDEVPWDQMARYNADDVRVTAQLFNVLRDQQPKNWEGQIRLTGVLLDMECAGLPIDLDKLEWTRESFQMTKDSIASELMEGLPAAFNLNSADQVAALLFLKEFAIPARIRKGEPEPEGFKSTKEGRLYVHGEVTVTGFGLRPGAWTEKETRPKVDAKTLAVKHGNHPWVAAYLEYQRLDKLLGTYLESLPKYTHEGRLYGTFNQAGTVTGRLSSANPNLQNQPRRGEYGAIMRNLFVGDFVIADFSQLEPRLMAHWSEDPELMSVYKAGGDIYRKTGTFVFDKRPEQISPAERDICKALVLSMGYGAQARKLAEILSVAGHPTTQRDAGRYLSAMQEAYAVFFAWKEKVIEESKSAGYVTTLAGRKRHISYGYGEGWKAERQAVNSIIQGSAADIVNATMLEVAKLRSLRILVQVHDELVCEVVSEPPELIAVQIAGQIGHGFKLRVPLVFEPKRVESWGEK